MCKKQSKYDIFISYRRKDTGDKAEHLKDLLEKERYKNVSFDRENLTGLFDVELAKRIDQCKDFLLVIGKNSLTFNDDDFDDKNVELYDYLGKCSQKEFAQKIHELGPNAPIDFVRIEIARALNREKVNIIPIVPESSDSFKFCDLNLPDDIIKIKRYEAIFFSDNPDALFKDIVPKLKSRLGSKPNSIWRRIIYLLAILISILAVAAGSFKYMEYLEQQKIEGTITEIYNLPIITELEEYQPLQLSPKLSLSELEAIYDILFEMRKVKGGTYMMGAKPRLDGTYSEDVYTDWEAPQIEVSVPDFWIARYEVSIDEWHRIMNTEYNPDSTKYPISNISYLECKDFIQKLIDHTCLEFSLPTEAEWEYAARGGDSSENTKYAGSDSPNAVAWYNLNANAHSHIRNDKTGGLSPNVLDLYDMSGNVCEWCDNDFEPYNPNFCSPIPGVKAIRGGFFDSDSCDVTIYQRDIMAPQDKSNSVGLRLIIKTK